jgi:hypothetical protein
LLALGSVAAREGGSAWRRSKVTECGPDRLAVPQRGYMEEERRLGRAARRLGEEAVGRAGQAPCRWDGPPQGAAGRRRLLAKYGTQYDEGLAMWLGGERLARPGRTLAAGNATGRRRGACPWQGHPVVVVHAGLRLND